LWVFIGYFDFFSNGGGKSDNFKNGTSYVCDNGVNNHGCGYGGFSD
jgi:hypothetical protein